MVKRFTVTPEASNPIVEIIDKKSVEFNQMKSKNRIAMYASDYGGCMKKIWMQFHPAQFPVSQEVGPKTARIFANGNDVHERLGSYLHDEKDLGFEDEITIPRDELDIHGRCDGILTLNKVFNVVEFKSKNAREITSASSEHEGQLTLYLYMFEQLRLSLLEEFDSVGQIPTEEGLKGYVSQKGRLFNDLASHEKKLLLSHDTVTGHLIYEAKHGQHVSGFAVPLDPAKVEAVRAWYTILKKHIDEDKMPEVKYVKSKFPCQWGVGNDSRCAYWELCHGTFEKEKLIVLGQKNE